MCNRPTTLTRRNKAKRPYISQMEYFLPGDAYIIYHHVQSKGSAFFLKISPIYRDEL